jgi:hypothetical protein
LLCQAATEIARQASHELTFIGKADRCSVGWYEAMDGPGGAAIALQQLTLHGPLPGDICG